MRPIIVISYLSLVTIRYVHAFLSSAHVFIHSSSTTRCTTTSPRGCISMQARKTAAILGASGYTGAELMRLLSNHPYIDVKVLTSTERNAGQEFKKIYPQFAYKKDIPKLTLWEDSKSEIEGCDVAFCCLPHGTTQEIIAELAAASSTGCLPFISLSILQGSSFNLYNM